MEQALADPTTWDYIREFFLYIYTSINLWAVLVSAVAAMFIGALWYGSLFGKQWMKLMSLDKKKIAKQSMPMWASYLLMFVGSLLTALVLALMLAGLPATTINQALVVTFLLWIGLVAPITLSSVIWEGKSFKLFFLNNGYNLLSLFVTAIILVSWIKTGATPA